MLLDLLINGLLPWIVYEYLCSQHGFSEYQALLSVTVIPGAYTLVSILRKGRPDLFASMSLVAILISLLLTAVTTDPKALQIRESYITALMGFLFIGSSLSGKPILWLLAKHQTKMSTQASLFDDPKRKGMMSRVNTVWGWSFLLEFAFKLWMIENLTIAQVLALSPVMFYGVTAVTFAWTVWWLRRQVAKT